MTINLSKIFIFTENHDLIIDNKIEKVLNGPSILIGITFLTLGLFFILNTEWIFGFALLIISLFLLLSYTGILIDTSNSRIKPYNNLFGIFKYGKWRSLSHYIGITLVPLNKVRTTFSRSNRSTSSKDLEYRIYLVNKAKKPETPIKKCKNSESAQNSLEEFSLWLKLPVFSVKR